MTKAIATMMRMIHRMTTPTMDSAGALLARRRSGMYMDVDAGTVDGGRRRG